MTDKKVWLITGAGRGLGVDITKAALGAGHAVVATGRDPDAVGRADGLLMTALDIASSHERRGRRRGRAGSVRSHRRPGEQRGHA